MNVDYILQFTNFSILKPISSLGLNAENSSKKASITPSDYLINNLTMSVQRHEILGIVGESGSGKSLTALSILQLLSSQLINKQSGEIFYEGKNILKLDDAALRQLRSEEIAMVFQEPMVALNPVHTIQKQLLEVFDAHKTLQKTSKPQKIQEILSLLEEVGVKNPSTRLNHYPHQFSGGERQRIVIAMAIIRNPKILIADEATTALDVTTQKQIIELLIRLKKERGMTLIFISHNLNLVRKIADRVAVMYRGKCIECQSTDLLFSKPKNEYTHQLITSNQLSTDFITTFSDSNTPKLLKIEDLTVKVKENSSLWRHAKKTILQDFNLCVIEGDNIGIVGESGSGKSTMALALTKLMVSSGRIYYNEIELHTLKEKAFRPLRKDIQIVFQDPYSSLNPQMTIFEIIAEGVKIHEPSIAADDMKNRIIEIIQEVGLDSSVLHKYPHQFSGGQRQRIAIARVMILNPKIVILDEPTSALDKTTEKQVIMLLNQLQKKHRLSYIIISHDLNLIKQLCSYTVVLRSGLIIEANTTKLIFEKPQNLYTKSLLDAVI